ncbi:MAG: hypothetical protein GXP56_13925 [Deltaproteobacteria bacterium]|nr:hypothetical protein [Deltaproteobacteria bacterium]
MSGWLLKGLKTGIRTTLYPKVEERAPGVSPGRPEGGGPPGDYEWAYKIQRDAVDPGGVEKTCRHSLHIRVVDGGACGACLSEISQITKPYYDIHRLGFFITPTPRAADLLLVAGPVTGHMKLPLKKAFEAMPGPKVVMAVGTCALSGGIFGPGFASGGGVSESLPVDIAVPGCPPPPLAIIHGLLLAAGRKAPAPLRSPGAGGRRDAQ